MANTYTLIASNTLGASAASVTFSSIPSTYTDLVLRMSVRTTNVDATDFMTLTFNGSTASVYSNTDLVTIGEGTGQSARLSNRANLSISALNSAGSTSNTFNNGEIYIPSYTASQNKPFSYYTVAENNATGLDTFAIYTTAALWRDTSAINQIALTKSSNSFVSGSSFFLYGIKNS